jgi:putative chitinase
MKLSTSQLAACLQIPLDRAAAWIDPINAAMVEFGIDSPARQAMFLPQIGHESARLTQLVENLNYRADRIRTIGNASPAGSRWRSLVPRADELAGSPERLGNAVYGGGWGMGWRPLGTDTCSADAG